MAECTQRNLQKSKPPHSPFGRCVGLYFNSLCITKLQNRLDLHQARAEIVSAENRWCLVLFSSVVRVYFDLPISGISKTQQLDSIFVSYRSAMCCITTEAIDVKAYYKLISAMHVDIMNNYVTCHAFFGKKSTFTKCMSRRAVIIS